MLYFSTVVTYSSFIRSLFPDDISADKRSRPTTASTKIRVWLIIIYKPQTVGPS